MKFKLVLPISVICLTLFAFTPSKFNTTAGGVKQLADGNYFVEENAISLDDAKELDRLTKKSKKTTFNTFAFFKKRIAVRVANEKCVRDKKWEKGAASDEFLKDEARVHAIMTKYLR